MTSSTTQPSGLPLRVWIDLANSPHPLLFAPIARRLEAQGHEIVVTVRDNAQTAELASATWPSSTVIGAESPAGRLAKSTVLARRVVDLARWARRRRPDVAVSHNSYAQIVAARVLGIPIVTANDFEHQPANHLAFRLATRVLVPEALRRSGLERQGARLQKTVFYPGLKEELYIGDFIPDRGVLRTLGIERSPDDAIVVARTPPTRAVYHRFPNPLFVDTLLALDKQEKVKIVVLTRHAEQRAALHALDLRHCALPVNAVDSRSLMHAADLVVGAGGTMTREAALLGIPTLSLFAGEQPAVDRWLEQKGLLRRIRSATEAVPVQRRSADPRPTDELLRNGARLIDVFYETIESVARNGASR